MSWEVARLWACDALKGAAANNAIRTKDATLDQIFPGAREREMRLPSVGVVPHHLSPITNHFSPITGALPFRHLSHGAEFLVALF
jgi:hypothetical protein